MPIPIQELAHKFIVVGDRITVAQVHDRVQEASDDWCYIVVQLAGPKYAVLFLADLIERLQKESDTLTGDMVQMELLDIPDFLAPLAADGVDNASVTLDEAKARARQLPGKRLVVLENRRVIGVLSQETRGGISTVDLAWLNESPWFKPGLPPAMTRPQFLKGGGGVVVGRDIVGPDKTSGGKISVGKITGSVRGIVGRVAGRTVGRGRGAAHPEPKNESAKKSVKKGGGKKGNGGGTAKKGAKRGPAKEDETIVLPPQGQRAEPPVTAVLGPEAEPPPPPEPEPEKRFINAEIAGLDPKTPLELGQTYQLAFDIDVEMRATAMTATAFDQARAFAPGEDSVDLTVQVVSDDFKINTDPQTLRVPRTGKSKKVLFEIVPQHQGVGVLTALFAKQGNIIQVMTLKLNVGMANQPGLVETEPLGRPVGAAFPVQPRPVSLTILSQNANFQLILNDDSGWKTCTLPLTLPELDAEVNKARDALLALVQLPASDGSSQKIYQTNIDIPEDVHQSALQRLAQAGWLLFHNIFMHPGADAQTQAIAAELRALAQKNTLKIQILSQQFMLPWGMLYVADHFDPKHVDPELLLGFKHIIEHIPLTPPTAQPLDNTINSSPCLTIGLNLNTDIGAVVTNQIKYWDPLQQRGAAKVTVRTTKDSVTQALGNSSTADQLAYFYCHAASKSLAEGGADASFLILSGNQYLTLQDLNLYAPTDASWPAAPLVFINACESEKLSPLFYNGFAPYFIQKGARGVIGTECTTPALFAAEWARRFFDRFLAGEPLGQAFLNLRREFLEQHNNVLGLIYALHCDGDIQVAPAVPV